MLLDAYKDGVLVETIELSASKRLYKVGRLPDVADIVLGHGSISRNHATLTVSASGSVVVSDVGSAQGTKISGKPLEPNRPYKLPPGRSLAFGASTRTFKLREGGSGFVDEAAVAAVVPQADNEPRVQSLLQVLRTGAAGERLRPDGYVRLASLLGTPAVQRCWAETELASLPARTDAIEATTTQDGELMLRAVDGHAEDARVDTKLRLAGCASLPELVVFCSAFKEWNAVRSQGVGAGRAPPRPIYLCTAAPAAGAKPPSLGRSADIHVFIETASLLAEGLRLFTVDGEARGADPPPSSAAPSTAAEPLESLVCVGAPETGLIGPWHFARVLNARDGTELMSAAETEPIRQDRARALAHKAAATTAAEEAVAARQRQREATRRREEAALEEPLDDPDEAERFNPYLTHWQE